MNNILLRTILFGAAGLAALASTLHAATGTSNSSGVQGNPSADAAASDTTPPAPSPAMKPSTPILRNDVRPAPSGAPSSDTRPPRPSQDNRNATTPRASQTPSAPAGAPASDTPPPAAR